MNEFIYGIGDLFEATFTVLPILGNIPNVIFSLICVGALYMCIKCIKGTIDFGETA